MSMIQLVIASALGFIAAEGGLYGMRSFAGWLQRGEVRSRIGKLVPSSAHGFVLGFVRYAAPVGASAAVIILGVWAVSDYIAAHSTHTALTASSFDATAATAADGASADDASTATPAAKVDPPAAASTVSDTDPYADADYKVHRRKHKGPTASLEETLLQRSETKARTELLRDIQLHVTRSQYDCEVADRAAKYLKAGLDVWGFGAWQAKYFPTDSYKGATLEQCKDIKSVIDPASLDLRSTVAQEKH
jgi:hypothetical protein